MGLEARIDFLEAVVAIRRLVGQYGLAFDTQDRSLLRTIFWDDAVMTSALASDVVEGIDAIVNAAEGLWAQMPIMHHWPSEPVIQVEGDAASAVTAVHAVVVNGQDGPLEISGRYRDQFHRRGEEWRFARRDFEMRYATPLPGWRPVMGTDLAQMQIAS